MPRVEIALPEHFAFSTTLEVRVSDLNYGNHVGNDAVLALIHEARRRYVRSLGHDEIGADGLGFVVGDAAVVYRAQAFYGDSLKVEVAAGEFQSRSCAFFYRVSKGDTTVAVLAYNCVLRDGQKAFKDHPGLSAVRCRTWYEIVDHQPGTPPLVMSAPREDDLADMVADIENARTLADSVVVYIHWGLRYVPKVISTYQPIIGHAAIDAGADIVIGHGPHVIKGVEVYQDKAIFYSIGNFLTTGRTKYNEPGTQEWNVVWMEHPHDPKVLYGFPEHAKRAMIPRLTFDASGLAKIEVLPTLINDQAQPRVLRAGDPEFESHFEYVKWASDTLENDLRVDGDVYVVGKARD